MAKKKKAKSPKEHHFWENVWSVICNKEDAIEGVTKATLSITMSVVLNSLSAMLCVISGIGVFIAVRQAWLAEWGNGLWISNIATLLFALLLCATSLMFALLLRGCANEVERESDKNYLVAVFSALTSFAALVVALVALLKG